MITVTVERLNHDISSFELSGHANSGPYGYDLVCAGVSAVSFGAVNAVMKLLEVELDIEQHSDGGYLSVQIPTSLDEEKQKKVQLIFEAMLVSLETIEREYGKFIQIIEK